MSLIYQFIDPSTVLWQRKSEIQAGYAQGVYSMAINCPVPITQNLLAKQ